MENTISSWHSYPSIFNMGHRYIKDLLTVPVYCEEKVDGSQFSFGIFDGEIKIRSKGCQMIFDAPEKMFQKANDKVKEISSLLHNGWTYRAEFLAKPKHNTLVYERVPKGNIIIFDVNTGEENYLTYEEKKQEADRLGLECVQLLYSGMVDSLELFRNLLETPSALGGQKIEGVVIKPIGYSMFGQDKKCLMGKFVSEQFKEAHSHAWKENNPTQNDILMAIGNKYNIEGRWMKAVQHLKESGQLEDSPKDIGLLMREIPTDTKRECEQEIKELLFAWAWPHLSRLVSRGFPEWYKEQLLKKQFENPELLKGS